MGRVDFTEGVRNTTDVYSSEEQLTEYMTEATSPSPQFISLRKDLVPAEDLR